MDHRIRDLIACLGARVTDRDRKARLSDLSSWLDDDKYVHLCDVHHLSCHEVRQRISLHDAFGFDSNLRVLDAYNARRSKSDKEKSASCGWDVCVSMRSMSRAIAEKYGPSCRQALVEAAIAGAQTELTKYDEAVKSNQSGRTIDSKAALAQNSCDFLRVVLGKADRQGWCPALSPKTVLKVFEHFVDYIDAQHADCCGPAYSSVLAESLLARTEYAWVVCTRIGHMTYT